jgi:hypothetical protein
MYIVKSVESVEVWQIFCKAEVTPKGQLLEEVEFIVNGVLEETRDELFAVAVERFSKVLKEKGLPLPKLSLKKRQLTRKGCNQLLA